MIGRCAPTRRPRLRLRWPPCSPRSLTAHPLPGAPHCPIFPANNPWNQRVDSLPVAHGLGRLIASIGLSDPVHPDFGTVYNGAPNGIPYAVVSNRHEARPRQLRLRQRVRQGPVPAAAQRADRGRPALDRRPARDRRRPRAAARTTSCSTPTRTTAGARWHAGSGAIFNLRSNHLRPAGWTSADAAGLPILPGLARYDEVARGSIDHALRFTANCTAKYFVYPARHEASTCSGVLPADGAAGAAEGERRHRQACPARRGSSPQALKRYGMILADNGSPWYISGAPNRRWNDDALHQLGRLTGRDFEVVDTSSLPHPGTLIALAGGRNGRVPRL